MVVTFLVLHLKPVLLREWLFERLRNKLKNSMKIDNDENNSVGLGNLYLACSWNDYRINTCL